MESDVGWSKGRGQTSVNTALMIVKVFMETSCMLNAAHGTDTHTHTHFTFRDFEFVVPLVPQAAPVAVGYPDGELGVWAVRGLQGEVSSCTSST